MRDATHNRKGFTIIEVLVVIAIMAILLAIAVPSVRNWSIKNQKSAAASEIYSLLSLARTRAVTNSRPVTVTFTTVAAAPGGSINANIGAPVNWNRTLALGNDSLNGVGLVSAVPAGPFTISPRGRISPGGFTLRIRDLDYAVNNEEVVVTVGILGDITITP